MVKRERRGRGAARARRPAARGCRGDCLVQRHVSERAAETEAEKAGGTSSPPMSRCVREGRRWSSDAGMLVKRFSLRSTDTHRSRSRPRSPWASRSIAAILLPDRFRYSRHWSSHTCRGIDVKRLRDRSSTRRRGAATCMSADNFLRTEVASGRHPLVRPSQSTRPHKQGHTMQACRCT